MSYRERRKAPLAPGRYTSLFFMDEVTALAAGHRPCALCRREAFERFRTALLRGGIAFGHADDIDERLHLERIDRRSGGKRLHHVEWNTLPEGALVTPDTGSGEAWLVMRDRLLRWTPGGYGEGDARPGSGKALLLTPPTIVAALSSGYAPQIRDAETLGGRSPRGA